MSEYSYFRCYCSFFSNDTTTTKIYTLSLHDALPICIITPKRKVLRMSVQDCWRPPAILKDRKSGSAGMPRPISYAVFCLKKKNQTATIVDLATLTGDILVALGPWTTSIFYND